MSDYFYTDCDGVFFSWFIGVDEWIVTSYGPDYI